MSVELIPRDALNAVDRIGKADIVIGIPSYNNVRTIGHVVRAAQAGLAKYFPQFTGVIINSDGGSKDGTRDEVLSSSIDYSRLLMLSTPLSGVHRLSFPYHGIPGKGSAFRLVFHMTKMLGAKACAVVDSDLRSITPEWFDLLIRPVLHTGFDFVAPYYHRHKYDGTITNSIIYPLTRTLYGKRIRQPIGGDFGCSAALVDRYISRDDWETDVARFGIDIWMTTLAVAGGFKVCQSFLGAKLHDAKDPGSDLSAMLQQVVASVFTLMAEFSPAWMDVRGSQPIDLFGFPFAVGLDPIEVNVDRMLAGFRRGCEDLQDVWSIAMRPETLRAVRTLSAETCNAAGGAFHIADDLWVRIIYDFATAFRRRPVERGQITRSLTPLYLARVASFVNETREMYANQVDDRIEELCLAFEQWKPYLIASWRGEVPGPFTPAYAPAPGLQQNIDMEV